MDASKAKERISLLLLRTEERGASPAEADSAARMVAKLLRQFPEIIGQQSEQRSASGFNRPQRPHHSWAPENFTPIRYTKIIVQTNEAILAVLIVNGKQKEVWLPLSQISIKTEFIHIATWLARANGLV